jgi:hypothetical protein
MKRDDSNIKDGKMNMPKGNRTAKNLRPTLVVSMAILITAFTAVSATGAAAAEFTFSAKGELGSTQTTEQVFTLSPVFSPVVCGEAQGTGKIESLSGLNQKLSILYSDCDVNIIGNQEVKKFTVEYNLLASNEVEILNNAKMEVPFLGCTTTVTAGQTVGPITYKNEGTGLLFSNSLSGIRSTSTGLCPNGGPGAGTAGTLFGSSVLHRINPETRQPEGEFGWLG